MKRMFLMLTMLLGVVMAANAQYITNISPRDGFVYFSDGSAVSYDLVSTEMARRGLSIGHLRTGETLEGGMRRLAADQYRKEIERRGLNTPPAYSPYDYGYGYGAGVVAPMFGGGGFSFSIGNGKWGVSSSSSNYGGYQMKSGGIRIGNFHIGGSSSGYSKKSSSVRTNRSSKVVQNSNSVVENNNSNETTVDSANISSFLGGF